MEEKKEEVKSYLNSTINPILKPLVESLVQARPKDIMKFIYEYAQIEIQSKHHPKKVDQQHSQHSIQESITKEEEEALLKKMSHRKKKHQEEQKSNRRAISAEVFGSFNKRGEFQPKVIKKTEESFNFIKQLLLKSIMFQGLSEQNIKIVIDAMQEQKCAVDDQIINEGEAGDVLYIIAEGQFECTKMIGGKKTYLKTYKLGDLFGQLSLMYNTKRAASIKCSKAGIIYALDRQTFTTIVQDSAMKRRKFYQAIVNQIEILSEIQVSEKEKLLDALKQENYEANEYIVREGETGDRLYFVIEGSLVAEKDNVKTLKKDVVFKYKEREYFGQISLIKNTVRQASVRAVTKCKLLSIGRQEFKRLLGPIQNILQRNLEKYKKFMSK